MRLDFDDGTLLWCRLEQHVLPHHVYCGALVCESCGARQHPANAIVALSVDDKREPAQLLPPRWAWSTKRVLKDGRLT